MAVKFGIKTFELCKSSSGYVWSFLVYTGQGMELTNQYVTAETNKTAAIVVTLVENLLGRADTQCGWIIFLTPLIWLVSWKSKNMEPYVPTRKTSLPQ
jgi:hypothetical protein